VRWKFRTLEPATANGVITDVFSSGTMVRGLEKILKGCDPRDAWAIAERVCGVCTTVHALTSVRAPWKTRSASPFPPHG
jgi:hydrogenase large subunit